MPRCPSNRKHRRHFSNSKQTGAGFGASLFIFPAAVAFQFASAPTPPKPPADARELLARFVAEPGPAKRRARAVAANAAIDRIEKFSKKTFAREQKKALVQKVRINLPAP
jgi:hypothetical protein